MDLLKAFFGLFTKNFRIYLHEYQTLNMVSRFVTIPRLDRMVLYGLLTIFHYLFVPAIILFFLSGNESLMAEFISKPNIFLVLLVSLIFIRRLSNDSIHFYSLLKKNRFSIIQNTFIGMLIWFLFKMNLKTFTS
jgi:hypothetical protein